MKGITKETERKINNPALFICEYWKDNECRGRVTVDHPLEYSGKQIKEPWSEIFVCEYHHSVGKYQDSGGLNKERNQWVALNKATVEQLKEYSKVVDLVALRANLNEKYD